ncbi:retrovirus-related pol polyprotein from transposon TNT 1-94 [Tanacetum coccineum]
MPVITNVNVIPKVSICNKYAIDVESIPPRNKNNREVHLDYLKHLKESVETLREIVEEAKVETPLDRSLVSACLYTKHSQELLEYTIGTCPKDFNQRDKNHVATPLTRRKQVTFEDQCETSNSNAHKHVKQLKIQKTNVPMPPSTRVNSCTDASGSQPRSKIKKNRILPAKSVNTKNVEEHPRTNKSSLQPMNRVDSSISSKRTVVQIVLWYLDSGCSKHMTGDRSRLRNFMKKFIGTVRFGNDHFGAIMGYVITHNEVLSNLFVVQSFQEQSMVMASSFKSLELRTINDLARKELVRGLPRLKFKKDHLCFACQLGKSKKHTHKPKTKNTNLEVLNTLHMDLCGPMRVQTINGKKYILVIIDDLSRFTWVKFLRSKDETSEFVIKFLKQIQAEAIATACYTQNRSLIYTRHNKTPYELVHDKKPDLTFFRVFGALCYPTNDSEDLGKLQPTADIRIFVGNAPRKKGYRIYNKRTRKIKETIHVTFDELTGQIAPMQLSTGPAPTFLMPGQISLGLVPNPVPAAPYVPPINKDLEILFQPMFDEYLEPPRVERPVSPAPTVPALFNSAGTPSSTTIDQDAPSPSHSLSSSVLQSPSLHQGAAAESTIIEANLLAPIGNDPFVNVFALKPSSKASSSDDVRSA